MQKCSNCGSNIRNKGIYCDQCGIHLKLLNEEIKFKSSKVDSINNLKKIILNALKHLDNHYINFEYYTESISAYLLECTNINVILKNTGISIRTIDFHHILLNIHAEDNELILDNFLYELNLEYKSKKKIERRELNVIAYTNIDSKLKENKIFTDILSLFNLEIFEFSDFNFNDGGDLTIEEQNYFNHNFLMFKFNSYERDYDVLKEKALNEVHAFFGYLTYSINLKKVIYKHSNNDLVLNHRLIDLKCTVLLIVESKNKIFMPKLFSEVVNGTKFAPKSNIKDLRKVPLIDFERKDKSNIPQKIKEYFSMYFLASSEAVLENSFINFYSLSERIIKDFANKIPDEKLISYMNKIWKITNFPDYMGQRINLIRIKRNQFVHENVRDEITTFDRNIMKIISESLICFLIDYLEIVNNIYEYKILLEYSNQDTTQKERLIDLINHTLND